MSDNPPEIVVCALYKFATLEDCQELRPRLLKIMQQHRVRGTLLLADEGINGTVAGSRSAIDALLFWLKSDPRLAALDCKESYTDKPPFKRTKVLVKKEIVTLGVAGIDPNKEVGTYVLAKDWNELISDPEVLLLDTRNDYEVQVGTFKNAINPKTKSFRQLPQYVDENLDPKKHKKVAMFCTGGIRCEKSTALLKQKGFDEVYHLQGGILRYLEEVSTEESLWQGECFVFDDRVTVNGDLQKGCYDQCHACRLPITAADKLSEKYQRGVSCPYCFDATSLKRKRQFAQREKQMQLAKMRGEAHIGADAATAIALRRETKLSRTKQQRSENH